MDEKQFYLMELNTSVQTFNHRVHDLGSDIILFHVIQVYVHQKLDRVELQAKMEEIHELITPYLFEVLLLKQFAIVSLCVHFENQVDLLGSTDEDFLIVLNDSVVNMVFIDNLLEERLAVVLVFMTANKSQCLHLAKWDLGLHGLFSNNLFD